jgi:hypothetical protein
MNRSSQKTRSLAELSSSLSEIEKSLQEVCEKHYSSHLSAASSLRDALQSVNAAAAAADAAASSCSEVVAQLTPGKTLQTFSELATEHSGLRKLLLAASGTGGTSRAENGDEIGSPGGAAVALELLEMPVLMSNCVRIALSVSMGSNTPSIVQGSSNSNASSSSQAAAFNAAEDALDILEFASSLFVSQKLWRGINNTHVVGGNKRQSALLRELVWSTRAAGRELEEGLLAILSTKPPLQVVLRVTSILKRIRAQQALARSKVSAESSTMISVGIQSPSPLAASAAQLVIDELQDSLSIRASFLAGRDESLSRDAMSFSIGNGTGLSSRSSQNSTSGAHHIALRAIDAHRSTLLESATHFTAISNSLNPSGLISTSGALAPLVSFPVTQKGDEVNTLSSLSTALDISSRILYSNFVSSVSQSTLAAIVHALVSLDDGMAAAAIAQQAAYAVRRGGRFAAADGIQLGVVLLAPKLAEGCAQAFEHARKCFSQSLRELCQSAGSYSDVGLSGNIASIFATLSNDTALAVNALRGFWHRDLTNVVSISLAHHADKVVVISEEALASTPGSRQSVNILIETSIKEMSAFIGVCQGISLIL